ncbi:MAG: cyclase family protein [Chryseolinea sp.]
MTKYIDLSHTIEQGMITYKGLPAPIVCDYLSREASREFYDPGTEFFIGKIEMITNTGTYLDCPFHRYEHGRDLSQLLLEQLADLEAIVIRMPHTTKLDVTESDLRSYDVAHKAVLINTGWDQFWRTDQYFENHPYLTEGAAKYLKDQKVKLVGIDSHNIDDTRTRSRPVHTELLGNEILIVEHLCNLDKLPLGIFHFTAIPPKFKGVGTFPVRAMARLW